MFAIVLITAVIRLADLYHEIAPPVDYSLTPRWIVFAVVFAALSVLGAAIWWWKHRPTRSIPPKLPRDRALEALAEIAQRIEDINAYQFSIEASDILRRYVTEQYGL